VRASCKCELRAHHIRASALRAPRLYAPSPLTFLSPHEAGKPAQYPKKSTLFFTPGMFLEPATQRIVDALAVDERIAFAHRGALPPPPSPDACTSVMHNVQCSTYTFYIVHCLDAGNMLQLRLRSQSVLLVRVALLLSIDVLCRNRGDGCGGGRCGREVGVRCGRGVEGRGVRRELKHEQGRLRAQHMHDAKDLKVVRKLGIVCLAREHVVVDGIEHLRKEKGRVWETRSHGVLATCALEAMR